VVFKKRFPGGIFLPEVLTPKRGPKKKGAFLTHAEIHFPGQCLKKGKFFLEKFKLESV